jgi:hypothetical protein
MSERPWWHVLACSDKPGSRCRQFAGQARQSVPLVCTWPQELSRADKKRLAGGPGGSFVLSNADVPDVLEEGGPTGQYLADRQTDRLPAATALKLILILLISTGRLTSKFNWRSENTAVHIRA